MTIRSSGSISAADGDKIDAILSRVSLVGRVMGLDAQNQEGQDITSQLAQLGITHDAFQELLTFRRLAAADSPISLDEWAGVENIFLEAQKRRLSASWRDAGG